MEDPQHGFQAGEVSAAHWDNEAGVQKLAIKLLHFLKCVGRSRIPECDCVEVLGLFGSRDGHRAVRKVP
jgi:hypothetical protein